MKCPHDQTPLEKKVVRGRATEVDRCPKCGGVWCEDGEVDAIIGAKTRAAIPASAKPTRRLCPRCATPLVVFGYPDTMTLLDGCRTCRGLWLDHGELEQIAKAPAPRPPRPPRPAAMHAEIPGVKGSLIRFIDGALASLMDGIRKG
jgi:Zn-finger nucleic acid-binding protein